MVGRSERKNELTAIGPFARGETSCVNCDPVCVESGAGDKLSASLPGGLSGVVLTNEVTPETSPNSVESGKHHYTYLAGINGGEHSEKPEKVGPANGKKGIAEAR